MGGDYSSRLKGERAWLLARIERDNDVTLEEIRAELQTARGLAVGYGTVWRFYAAEASASKKTVHAAEQERPDVAEARANWQLGQELLTLQSSSSSTKPVLRPAWRGCMDVPSVVCALWPRALGPLEGRDVHRCAAPRWHRCTLRHRQAMNGQSSSRTSPVPRSRAAARRRCRHG